MSRSIEVFHWSCLRSSHDSLAGSYRINTACKGKSSTPAFGYCLCCADSGVVRMIYSIADRVSTSNASYPKKGFRSSHLPTLTDISNLSQLSAQSPRHTDKNAQRGQMATLSWSFSSLQDLRLVLFSSGHHQCDEDTQLLQ